MSMSGFEGALDRGLDAPDIALPRPTREANGASSESDSDSELDESLECSCFEGTFLAGKSTEDRLFESSALVDTDPRDLP